MNTFELKKTPIWQIESGTKQLADLGRKIADEIAKLPYFCLWLQGDIGAGKTTLTGFIMQGLGLDPKIPVTSPTYSYINDYVIGARKFAHIDLYRASTAFSPTELFHLEEDPYAGLLIEWPEIVDVDANISPTHLLTIEYLPTAKSRLYRFFSVSQA
jgi:tRNA threonylcarbamoyl adenosine modification protein YjeE